MLKPVGCALVISLTFGIAGCAPTVTSQTVMVAGLGPVDIEQINVEIVAVAPALRMATVRQGRFVWDVAVPEGFGDLQNVSVGDRLQISRAEGAVLGVRRAKKGARPGIVYTEIVSAPSFQNLPDKFVVRSLTLTARFERFDLATNMVSYVGPAGPRSLAVADPAIKEDLQRLRRGDMVDLTLAEAVYIQKN
jgi:hypothetical protein